MIFKDYYRILELNSSKVTLNDIKVAYRELAKKYHPDVNIGNSKAEERFKDINESYKVLSDSAAKRKYDRVWNNHVGKKKILDESKQNEGNLKNEFFDMFFGKMKAERVQDVDNKNKKRPVKVEYRETDRKLSIQEAFYGMDKKISLRTVNGKMKTFTIKVPAGIRDGEKVRLLGQGKEGKNGGKNGDLFIKINIEGSQRYKLDGYDLITDLYLTPWEAALGTRVTISGIDESVSLFVPPGIQSGEKVRIAKKGYKDGKGSRGDLVTEIKIMVPKKLTDEERELFEKLSEISTYKPRNS